MRDPIMEEGDAHEIFFENIYPVKSISWFSKMIQLIFDLQMSFQK
jgi:hypothetical protein